MASSNHVEIEGYGTLRATLRKAGADLEDMRTVNNQVAQFVGATAAQRAPRRSGLLAASWAPSNSKSQATVRFPVPYANAIHWGTGARVGRRGPHNISPTLFATSAAADTEPTWGQMYRDRVQQVLDRVRGA